MTMGPVLRFAVVGLLGLAVQVLTRSALVHLAHWPWILATIAAVECAIVHNYMWHERWTWPNRCPAAGRFRRFLTFNTAAAVTSMSGNIIVMAVLVDGVGLPAVPSNVIAVVVMGSANFVFADRAVFASALRPNRSCLAAAVIGATCVLSFTVVIASPDAAALEAWTRYVEQAEARIQSTNADTRLAHRSDIPIAAGDTIDVKDGTISDWRGSVLVRGVTVDEVLDRVRYPGTPPPQEDVVASRVLWRSPDAIGLSMRLVRRSIVTVTYDTEHAMVFRRASSARATAGSVATRIDEVGGGDHGFLWKLNSYWQYDRVDEGVLVSLESLTLSRDVPMLLKPLAARIVPRVARDSMVRTLLALKRYLEPVP
jgi:putative flippase GtrA